MKKFDALHFLRQLMNIDSQTRNVSGVNSVQNLISAQLIEWGYKVDFITHPQNKSGDLVVATKESSVGNLWVNFIGHADTVLPAFPIEIGPVIWKGSGIADNKGGVVTLLQTLWNIREKNLPFNLRVVISPNEEAGSPGFQEYFKTWGEEAFLNLGFEPALENDELITSRNGNRWYEIKLDSVSAHTGRAQKGRMNLIHRASEFIANLEDELKDEPKIKFNVTSIQTENQTYNVIPDQMILKLDARFNSFRGRDLFHSLLESELCKMSRACALTGTQINSSFSIADDCPPMSASAELDLEGISYCSIHAGGAADINYFSHPDNFCLDGWGARGAQLHSKEEWLDTQSIYERAHELAGWLTILAEKKTEIRIKPDSVLNYHSSRP